MEIIALTTLGIFMGSYLGYSLGWRYARQQFLWEDGSELTSFLQTRATTAVRERIQKRLNRIMEAATEAGQITNDDVEDMFCIGDRTASRYLRQLVAQGRLRREGTGRGTYYEPAVQTSFNTKSKE